MSAVLRCSAARLVSVSRDDPDWQEAFFHPKEASGIVVQLAKDGYAVTTHKYEQPGVYLVRVSRTNKQGFTATAHLKVFVERSEK